MKAQSDSGCAFFAGTESEQANCIHNCTYARSDSAKKGKHSVFNRRVVHEQLQVPAQMDYLTELRDFVVQVGTRHAFPDNVVNAFKLSVEEACTNIIKHAYEEDGTGNITMRIVVRKDRMSVILMDQGKYFDPSRVKNPDLKHYVATGKRGGLGIFIMRKLVDNINYRRTEHGNELTLTKFRRQKLKKPKLPSFVIPLIQKIKDFRIYWWLKF